MKNNKHGIIRKNTNNLLFFIYSSLASTIRFSARIGMLYSYILPLLNEICNWLYTEEAEKLYKELVTIT